MVYKTWRKQLWSGANQRVVEKWHEECVLFMNHFFLSYTLRFTQSCILYLNREAFFCRVCFERKMYLLSAPLTNPPFLYVSSSHSCIVRWAYTLSTGCSTSLLVLLAYLSLNINSPCYASFLCRLMQVCVFFSSISRESCPPMSCRHALPNVDTLQRSVINLI